MLSHIATREGDAANIEEFGQGAPSTEWTRHQNDAYQKALGAYLQYPVPGLGSSFRDKWAADGASNEDVLAEIDQFAYNLQTAAAATFQPVTADYDGQKKAGNAFNGRSFLQVGGLRAFSAWANETPSGNRVARALFPGVYSGRGIGRHINAPTPVEIALRVTPRRQSEESPSILHLEFRVEVDFLVPEGFQNKTAGTDWGVDLPVFRVSYLECKVNGELFRAKLDPARNHEQVEANPTRTEYLFSANPGPDGENPAPYTLIRGGEIITAATPQGGAYAFEGGDLATPNTFFAHKDNLEPKSKSALMDFTLGESISITDIQIRMVTMFPRAPGEVVFVIPSAGRPGTSVTGMTTASEIEDALITLPNVSLDSAVPGIPAAVSSSELSDPRLAHRADAWVPAAFESLGVENPSFLAQVDRSKLSYPNPASVGDSYYPVGFRYPYASPGFIFSLPTGQQRGLAWQTVDLAEKQSAASGMPPDYLLADLILPTAPDFVKQHASSGKININTRIYPKTFGSALDRGRQVLISAVSGIRYNSTSTAGGLPINAESFADWLVSEEPDDGFPFYGRVLENPALDVITGSEHSSQLLRAKIMGLFTTQSNTFTVYGLVESIDDIDGVLRPTGRQLFQAVIERQIFPGRDGIRGNGRTDETGNWIEIAGVWKTSGSERPAAPGDAFDTVDGPDSVDLPLPPSQFRDATSASTLLEDSFNPVLPYYTYELLQVTPLDR